MPLFWQLLSMVTTQRYSQVQLPANCLHLALAVVLTDRIEIGSLLARRPAQCQEMTRLLARKTVSVARLVSIWLTQIRCRALFPERAVGSTIKLGQPASTT